MPVKYNQTQTAHRKLCDHYQGIGYEFLEAWGVYHIDRKKVTPWKHSFIK